MDKSVLVLGVPHQLQGPHFENHVDDPSYRVLAESLIRNVDFVFEEAAGQGPSIAENLVNSIRGLDHYLDVDPSGDDRPKYGIGTIAQQNAYIDPKNSEDMYSRLLIDEQTKREELWQSKINNQEFRKALMICGIGHGLSFAFRLIDAGFIDVECYSYIPFEKIPK